MVEPLFGQAERCSFEEISERAGAVEVQEKPAQSGMRNGTDLDLYGSGTTGCRYAYGIV